MAVFTEGPLVVVSETAEGALSCLFSAAFLPMVFIKLLLFYMSGQRVYVHTGQERAWAALDQMVVGCHLCAGDQTQVLWKSMQCF